jgi:hypothetical protein
MRFLILASGVFLILIAYLNWRGDLFRTWVKQLDARLFRLGGGPLGAFAETRVGRIYYRQFASILAALLGIGFLMGGLQG